MSGETEVVAYAKFEIDCPECGDVTSVEHDPSGEVLDCYSCEERLRVVESR